MIFNGKILNTHSLEVEGIDTGDFPDFCDSYFSYGEYDDGTVLSEDDLVKLGEDHGDLLHETVFNSLF